jgi:allantoinase
MSEHMHVERAIRSRRVVTPTSERPAAVLISGGKIAAIVGYDDVPDRVSTDDYGDLALLPGMIDVHVHCNEPGRTEWEGFATATRAASVGGVTTIVDMPLNSSPVTTSVSAFQEKLAATEGKLHCDVGFWGGIVPGNLAEIEPLLAAGVLGFKAFLCHSGIEDFPNSTEADLRAAMPLLAAAGVPLLAHAEIAQPVEVSGDPRRYATWLAARPQRFEHNAIRQLIDLCRETGCRTHIVHLADADALPMLAAAKAEGLPLSVETCFHYLHFAAEEVPEGATEFKCAPPIRESSHRERLWQGLCGDEIDLVASDHSPCPPAMKCRETGDFLAAWGGIASLQLGLPIVWTGAAARSASLRSVARWFGEHPAKLAGLSGTKGTIAVGKDADLVVFDPDVVWAVDAAALHHRHKLTPYAGKQLRGRAVATYLRGELIGDESPRGRAILRRGNL